MNTKTVHYPRKLYEFPAHDVEYINVTDLKQYLDEHPFDTSRGYVPSAFYNRDGDLFEVHWKQDQCYEETRGKLSVLISMDTKEVVGVKFYGIKKLMGLVEVKEETVEVKEETVETIPYIVWSDPSAGDWRFRVPSLSANGLCATRECAVELAKSYIAEAKHAKDLQL